MKKYIYQGIYISTGVFLTLGVQALMSLHVPITIEYGKYYTVQRGFYRGCAGRAYKINDKEVYMDPLYCNTEVDGKTEVDTLYKYINKEDL